MFRVVLLGKRSCFLLLGGMEKGREEHHLNALANFCHSPPNILAIF